MHRHHDSHMFQQVPGHCFSLGFWQSCQKWLQWLPVGLETPEVAVLGVTASKRDCGLRKASLVSHGVDSHHCFCCHDAVQHPALVLPQSYFGLSAAAAILRNSLGLGTSFLVTCVVTIYLTHLQPAASLLLLCWQHLHVHGWISQL